MGFELFGYDEGVKKAIEETRGVLQRVERAETLNEGI